MEFPSYLFSIRTSYRVPPSLCVINSWPKIKVIVDKIEVNEAILKGVTKFMFTWMKVTAACWIWMKLRSSTSLSLSLFLSKSSIGIRFLI